MATSPRQAADRPSAEATTAAQPIVFGDDLGWSMVDAAPPPAAASEGECAAETAAGTATPGAERHPELERNPELDLCFLCDCTGSMGTYIYAAQQNIRNIVERISVTQEARVRFGLISYRDHPPQDKTYVTRVFSFTADVTEMKGYVDTMSAAGGGDGPEAVTAALYDALHLPWRPNATKVVVLIADAPPHGLEPSGDGFPNGDPEGRDPLEIARQLAAHGIACYSVGCEPALGAYRFARDFMCTLAEITGGQAVALDSAELLAEVIVNGSAEEISLTMLQRQVDEEVAQVRAAAARSAESLSDAECIRRACMGLQQRNVFTSHMKTDGCMKNAHHAIWHASPTETLATAKSKLCSSGADPAHVRSLEASEFGAFAARSEAKPSAMSRNARKNVVASASMVAPPPAMMAQRSTTSYSAAPPPSFESMLAAPSAMMAAPPSMMSVPMPQQQASTSNVITRDLISEHQVNRLMQRSAQRKLG